VAWLSCTEGDAMARYSGWMAIFEHVAASLPRADRTTPSQPNRTASGPTGRCCPLRDLSPVALGQRARRYDRYLRANRVHEGWLSAVVRLMLGTGLRSNARGYGSSAPRPDGIEIVEILGSDRWWVVVGARPASLRSAVVPASESHVGPCPARPH
jgi:hypothetical protein